MAFNAYYKWLGIPPEEQPPTHYRLLGLRPFETDADVIENAAEQRLLLLRGKRQNLNDAERLMIDVVAARNCLLDSERRSAYNSQLLQNKGETPLESPTMPSLEPSELGSGIAGMDSGNRSRWEDISIPALPMIPPSRDEISQPRSPHDAPLGAVSPPSTDHAPVLSLSDGELRAKDPSTKHDVSQEWTYYHSGDVSVTSRRFCVGSTTYALTGITSVSFTIYHPHVSAGVLAMTLGSSMIILAGLCGLSMDWVVGTVLAVAGLSVIAAAAWAAVRSKFVVRIATASGEINALESYDGDQVRAIVRALNDAMAGLTLEQVRAATIQEAKEKATLENLEAGERERRDVQRAERKRLRKQRVERLVAWTTAKGKELAKQYEAAVRSISRGDLTVYYFFHFAFPFCGLLVAGVVLFVMVFSAWSLFFQ